MATTADFSNMLNQKAVKKPKKKQDGSPWIHMETKGGKK